MHGVSHRRSTSWGGSRGWHNSFDGTLPREVLTCILGVSPPPFPVARPLLQGAVVVMVGRS
jgi:hypothetical protein